jgi:predicted DNA-binding transcriptional regulator AlpA
MQLNHESQVRRGSTAHLRDDPDRLIDTAGFAQIACISETYARQLRVLGGGPRFIKLTSKSVRYRLGDVLAWIDSRPAASSTSELEVA